VTWILIVLFVGPPPPQGVVIFLASEAECRAVSETFCSNDERYRCYCKPVSEVPGSI
jgi:hypothetical protein